jgi:hypothetical protein
VHVDVGAVRRERIGSQRSNTANALERARHIPLWTRTGYVRSKHLKCHSGAAASVMIARNQASRALRGMRRSMPRRSYRTATCEFTRNRPTRAPVGTVLLKLCGRWKHCTARRGLRRVVPVNELKSSETSHRWRQHVLIQRRSNACSLRGALLFSGSEHAEHVEARETRLGRLRRLTHRALELPPEAGLWCSARNTGAARDVGHVCERGRERCNRVTRFRLLHERVEYALVHQCNGSALEQGVGDEGRCLRVDV